MDSAGAWNRKAPHALAGVSVRRADVPRKGASMAEEEVQVSVSPDDQREKVACTPTPVRLDKFNKAAKIPHGLTTEHIFEAMNEFINFIGFINTQLNTKNIQRFESMLMPANFSSMVGEFMTATI